MKTLFWDCSAGIAGNMAVASLLDLGLKESLIRESIASLRLPEGPPELIFGERMKSGIRGRYFNTGDEPGGMPSPPPACAPPNTQNQSHAPHHSHNHGNDHENSHEHHHEHGHDHEDDHTHDHSHGHDHGHDDDHGHSHDHEAGHSHIPGHPHEHDQSGPAHSHHQRGFSEICRLIEHSELTARAKVLAIASFRALGEAEAHVHGVSLDQVHFHEVGARDSIADIVGVAVCLDALDIGEVYVSPIHVGRGFVRCQHGRMPIPAPATAMLLTGQEIFSDPSVHGELTTPTGAALLRGCNAKAGWPPGFIVEQIGHGAGTWDLPIPNLLRAFVGSTTSSNRHTDQVMQLETHVDNVTGEVLGSLFESLLGAGALDVCCFPITMKKGRPGHCVRVICPVAGASALEGKMFAELPTLGIRRAILERSVLHRETATVPSPWGILVGKRFQQPDGSWHVAAEWSERDRIAREHGLSLLEVDRQLAAHRA